MKPIINLVNIFAVSVALFVAAPALASDGAFTPDSVSVEAGSDFKSPDTTMWRVGAQWDWNAKWFEDYPVFIGGYWDTSIGAWHSHDVAGDHDVIDFGITPVFRIQKSGATNFIPYAEIAIGAHYLTATDITNTRRFSTHFQFGDHVGAGFRFGEGGKFDLGYRLQHLSNAGIDHPNPGINFHQIRFEYHF
jgi:lipid A 3-O-deacylase